VSNLKGILDSAYGDTLLGSFVGDGCLDELRQIASDFGARPYRVFLVRTLWKGGKRGRGPEQVISETEILPTPKVETMMSVQLQMLDVGVDEQGGMTVSEISPRYTENQLLGRNEDGTEIADNETFSWEISMHRGDSDDQKRRRYNVKGVPSYEPTGLQWKVSLVRSGSDRQTGGNPK